jgi:transcriptional regulator with XRE-family HTH domain
MNTMADRIARKRRELGINQSELARRVGCSRQTVSQWENGHIHDLTGQHLRALARELGVEAAWILNGKADQCRSTSGKFDQEDIDICERIHNLTPEERAEIAVHLDELDKRQREVYELLRARFERTHKET